MNNKILWGALLVIIITTIGTYIYNQNKQDNLVEERNDAINQEVQRPEITLNAKHQFKNGKHIFVGQVELPTPCHIVIPSVQKNQNETIINIDTKSDAEVCAQVITNKEFRVTFDGTAEENIIAKLNGELVNLNLFEIDADQNIDEVDIFNKG